MDNALLRGLSPEMAAAMDVAFTLEGLLVAVTNQECDDILSRTPGSIGPTSLTELRPTSRLSCRLTLNGVAPTLPNLASGAYPIAKTLIAVSRRPALSAGPPLPRVPDVSRGSEILEQTGNSLAAAAGPNRCRRQ